MMLVRALVRLFLTLYQGSIVLAREALLMGEDQKVDWQNIWECRHPDQALQNFPRFWWSVTTCYRSFILTSRLIALTTNLGGFQNTSAQPLCYQPLPHSWRMSTWPEQNNSLNFPHCTSYVFTNKTLEAEARNSVLHNAKIRQSFSFVNMTHRQGCSLESFASLTSTFMVSSNFYIDCSRVVCTVELLMIPELPSYLQRNWPLSKLQPTEV